MGRGFEFRGNERFITAHPLLNVIIHLPHKFEGLATSYFHPLGKITHSLLKNTRNPKEVMRKKYKCGMLVAIP